MTKTKIGFFWVCGLFVVLSTNIFFAGCTGVDPEYSSRLDSLDVKLTNTRNYLSIDVATIGSRSDLIFDHLRYIKQFHADTMSEEFGNSLAKYKGIRKSYGHFLKRYSDLFNEMKLREKQVSDLRISVEKRQVSKAKFKSFYAMERRQIDINQEAAKQLYVTIHSLEPEYQRISRLVNDRLTQIAEDEPKLREYLDGLRQEADSIH